MARRSKTLALAALAAVAALITAGSAGAQLTPPWCGTPAPDAAGNLPDGSDPSHPAGSFAHIPYYAIGCTLDGIEADQLGNRLTVAVIGQSALGRDMYGVVVNAQDTPEQIRDFRRWQKLRGIALSDPHRAQALLAKWGDDVKVPIFVQGAIHGNEYEGVESNMQIIQELATTPYGENPAIDDVLDHAIVIFNVIQNPDGRVAGTRSNGNGFDLNRDFMTQSQPEVQAAVALIQEWLPVEVLDLHGYTTPTLIEATTKPHNPSIEYDLWLKWNQARIDANEAAMNAVGLGVQRPINDWCPEGNAGNADGLCDNGETPGPAVAEGWDDWGPFYTPMYAQHVGLNGSTVEMCNRTDDRCGVPGSTEHQKGRLGAYLAQYLTTWSTFEFDVANRNEILHDEMERYRRGVDDEPRPDCCPPPFDVANNWMVEFPKAYVIPLGEGQRSDAEANRLLGWLLRNGIEVEKIVKRDAVFEGRTLPKGSYVVWMDQAHRGLADTALSIGEDVSADISRLYAPPASWSHGYLWGADVVTIPDGADFSPQTRTLRKATILRGGTEPGRAEAYALELDSPTAVRVLNELVGGGLDGDMAMEPFASKTSGMLPAGSILFAADQATRIALNGAGRDSGITFRRVVTEDFPSATKPVEDVPRIAVLTGNVNQDVWSLRNLGFPADPVSTGTINSSPTDPLVDYDVIWNRGNWPSASNTTARDRLTAFFAAGGGFVGADDNSADFLADAGQVAGLEPALRSGSGRSGIVRWSNEAGVTSPIVGTYPAEDTAIMDPPTWFTAVPPSLTVDARLLETDFFASGFWPFDAQSATAPGSPIVVHGMNDAGTARVVVFAINPLYRADPEREWPMVGAAAYWTD